MSKWLKILSSYEIRFYLNVNKGNRKRLPWTRHDLKRLKYLTAHHFVSLILITNKHKKHSKT